MSLIDSGFLVGFHQSRPVGAPAPSPQGAQNDAVVVHLRTALFIPRAEQVRRAVHPFA